jgi:hypothetical protein
MNTPLNPQFKKHSVSRCAYIYKNWSAIALGMLIATVFFVLINMVENIVVKIALIAFG